MNPRRDGKEHCKAITLRSGKTVERPAQISTENDEDGVESAETTGNAKMLLKNSASKEQRKTELKAPSREDTSIVPYPQILKKNKFDNRFNKFMEIFKKPHINIPFADALEQMPLYVKFMKEILANKRKLSKYETVVLSKECSVILQRKFPLKVKDPVSYTILCAIGNSVFEKALCDLGAGINLMPLSIFRKLYLGEANPITITLQLADQSLTHPRGIIEDVLVKVDKFIFPADFIVLDMVEDKEDLL